MADPSAAPATRPTRRQAIALITVVLLTAAGVALVSWLLKPSRAQAFDLFHGSIYINDVNSPVSVDLASGKPTVRLSAANEQVGANDRSDLVVYPLQSGTLLLNRSTGEFNMVDDTGFVIKTGSGVPLPARAKATGAQAVATGEMAYIVRTGGHKTDVYLVSQATVQAASAPKAKVDPRAYRTVADDLAPGLGSIAAANGDFWALTGAGDTHRLWHLVLPRGSNNGVALAVASSSTLTGTTAIGVATAATDGSGGDVVALGSTHGITLTQPNGTTRTVSFPAIQDVDTLVPATNQHGRLAFLYHGADGWGVYSIKTDGSGLQAPHVLTGLPAGASLAQPATSRGELYTMDRTSGKVLRIRSDEAESVADYPVATQVKETRDFTDVYLIARGPRVIVDSPNHSYALTLFTDSNRPPQRIDKTAAVDVNAAGGVDALTRPHVKPGGPTKPPTSGKPQQQPAQPINNHLDCKKTTQIPHQPVFTNIDPGSRSVHLEWTYLTLDTQDCYPSTYTLSVKLISAKAPSPPGTVTVQGQTAVNLTGLFPSTQYEITLTAYINKQGTSAPPELVTTGPEGPAAPTGVHVAAMSTGDWVVSWNSCGGIQQGCVPAASWDVLPSFCDGRGVSGPLTPLNVIGDPTLHTFTATYPGGGALLGRKLNFIVQGRGEEDTKGTPSATSACVQSWSPPIADGITINASQPATTTVGGTASTTVTVNLGANAQRAIGGIGGTVTFELSGPGGTQMRGPATYDGSSAILTATFNSIQAGAVYSASAIIAPPGHAASAITKGPTPVSTSAAWPAFSVSANCPANAGPVKLHCDLSVTLTGPASSNTNNEAFDLTDQSRLQCGQRATPLTKSGFDPAHDTITASISLLLYRGTCTVYIQLVESSTDPPPKYFGGTVSDVQQTDVDLGAPTTLNATASDFDVAWNGPPGSHVVVKYTGSFADSDVASLTQNWQEIVFAPDNTACGSDSEQPTSAGITFDPTATCVNQQPGGGWTVQISYDDAGTTTTYTFTENLTGGPPGYVPCTVDQAAFTAAWTGTHDQPAAELTFNGNAQDLAGCKGWSYDLVAPDSSTCNSVSGQDPTSPVDINASCASPPPSAGDWTIKVSYSGPEGSRQPFTVVVGGNPP